LTDEKPSISFGQELLTQEFVTFERIHVNVSQTLIITTEDRMNLWLSEVIARVKKQSEWIAPLGLVIAVTLTLTTASFKSFILPPATWHAIFVIVDIAAFLWLIVSLRHLRKPLVIAEEIARLKTYSPISESNPARGRQEMNASKKVDAKQLIKSSGESFTKGNYAEAESLIREALFAAEKEGNLNDTASSLHNLGTILSRMGRYEEALASYSKALTIKEKLGDQGPSVATTLNQLAQVYSAMRQYQQAEKLYEKSLSMVERIGDKNAEAIVLSNLASVYASQGRLSEAEALYRKALEIQEESGNWQSATTYNNLGNLYFSLHDLGKAHNAFQKSVSLLREHLGDNHPDTSSVLSNLAYVLDEEGKNEEAAILFRESLENLKNTLGINHPYVIQLAERERSLAKGT